MEETTEEAATTKGRQVYTKLPDDVEEALVRCLLQKEPLSFKKLCDDQQSIFGSKGSQLRKRVQKRREYFLRKPSVFQKLVRELLNAASPPFLPNDHNTPVAAPSLGSSSNGPRDRPASFARESLVSPRRLYSTSISPSPFRPSKLENMSDDEDDSDVQRFRLDFERPWRSPCNGMIAVKGIQWEDPTTRQVLDKLSLYKPIFDIKDFQAGRYSARLAQDGSGVYITEPTVPQFFWSDDLATSVQAIVDGGANSICKVTEKSFNITTTRLQENKEFRTCEVLYLFPKGITCNNEFFNNDSTGVPPSTPYKLVTKMHLQKRDMGNDGAGDIIYDFMPFVAWKMAIDGADARTRPKQESSDNGLSDALGALGISLGMS
jgi:hypothetical protein